MPITKGAKKAVRSQDRKAVFNLRRKRRMLDVTKKIEKMLEGGEVKEAKAKLPEAYKAIDKAAKMNTLKKGTASRRKAKLSRMIKVAETGGDKKESK
ncbi:30S ribosomal protein S20 [Candidatus Pacebacteria bacterium]|nr:30S ribosomal protein S20 [Candidatus Paceibacterota bacterium]